jgi:hypothetical protein
VSGRGHTQVALERRVRRVAVRHGLNLLIAQKPDAKVLQHGGYMLRDGETSAVVFGERGYAFSATLDEIEEYLLGLGK